jgi:hypothetical protein
VRGSRAARRRGAAAGTDAADRVAEDAPASVARIVHLGILPLTEHAPRADRMRSLRVAVCGAADKPALTPINSPGVGASGTAPFRISWVSEESTTMKHASARTAREIRAGHWQVAVMA